jgi:membrane protein DedA with SNARE-associated domain
MTGNGVDTLIELLQNFSTYLKSGNLPQLGYWNYVLLAVLVAVEGPIATLLGAAAASAGWMRPVPVFLAAAAGNLTADTLWYSLGYAGKADWLLHGGRRLGIQRQHLERLQSSMRRHAVKILFFAKLSMSLIIPSLIAAGLARAPWRRWFPAVFGAEMIWTGSLVVIGYYATEAIKHVTQGLEYLALAGSAVFALVLLWYARHLLRGHFGQMDTFTNGEN